MSRSASSPTSRSSVLNRDGAMREALRRESVEVVSHQLEVERQESARRRGTDMLIGLGLMGAVFAVGYKLYERRPALRRT